MEKPISPLTNSPAGSTHWYRTLLAKIRHAGEVMQEHEITPEQRVGWGKMLESHAVEMIQYVDQFVAPTEREPEYELACDRCGANHDNRLIGDICGARCGPWSQNICTGKIAERPKR